MFESESKQISEELRGQDPREKGNMLGLTFYTALFLKAFVDF